MFSGTTLCLAWVVCVGVCFMPYIHGQQYDGNCQKTAPDNCTKGVSICGPPGNCPPNGICQYKCHFCNCTRPNQCYFISNGVVGCNCTGSGYTGSKCEIDIDECKANPCKNGAKCCNGAGTYDCFCAAGYTGTHCEININECAWGIMCQNNGTCIDDINAYMCNCADGFTGDNCEINTDECATASTQPPCQNGGTCIDGINGYSCHCPAGFTGDHCETDINECAAGNPCGGCGYTCSNSFGGYDCDSNKKANFYLK